MAVNGAARHLHYSLKISDRTKSYEFFVKVLGMKVLQHVENDSGCKAECNGKFDNAWSKTVVGYGDQKHDYAFELIYNYGVTSYDYGNDFGGASIASKDLFGKLTKHFKVEYVHENKIKIHDPDVRSFYVLNQEKKHPIYQIEIRSKCIAESIQFWHHLIGMKMINFDHQYGPLKFTFGDNQTTLKITQLQNGNKISRGNGYGRIAFGCDTSDLEKIEESVRHIAPSFVYKPLMSLGKGIKVLILVDNSGHEVCIVGTEAFYKNSSNDHRAGDHLLKSIEKHGE